MKRTIPALLAMLLGATSLFAAGELSGRRAPGFSLMDSNFTQHDLQDYQGKIVVIDFMQTTCPVCNKVADLLVKVKDKYGDRIGVISIVTLPDNFKTADAFAAGHELNWPILFDSGQMMMSYMKMRPDGNMNVHFPHIFIVDAAGTIRNDFDGSEEAAASVESLSAQIDKLLK